MAQLDYEYNFRERPGKNYSYKYQPSLNYVNIFISIAAFLTARAELFEVMSPFGLAFVAACGTTPKKRALAAMFSVIGIITTGASGADPARYISALVVYMVAQMAVDRGGQRLPVALVATLSLLAAGIASVIINNFVPYDIFMLALEGIICCAAVAIFKRGVFLAESLSEHRVAAMEESISLSVLIGVCIFGFSKVSLPWNISISNTLCALAILLASLNGTATAALTGLGCGVITSLSYFPSTDAMGAYALCGMAAGFMRRFGKTGVTVGFVVSNTLLHIYMHGWNNIIFNVYEQAIALGIMWLIPMSAVLRIGEIVGTGLPGSSASDRVRKVITRRLGRAAGSFDSLADSLHKLSNWSGKQGADITVVFDEAANRVCKRCTNAFRCWQHEFNTTYDSLMHVAPVLEEYGEIEVTHLPDYFANRCVNARAFVAEINKQYGGYRVENIWQKKIDSSRKLVTDQLHDVSKIVSKMSSTLADEIKFDISSEEQIITALKNAKIRTGEVTVIFNAAGRCEIDLTVHPCGGMNCCKESIQPVISAVMDKHMLLVEESCGAEKNKSRCNLRFVEQTPFVVDCGAACMAKEGQSENGDNYCLMPISSEKYVMAISDGMGSGKKAASQSNTAVELLGKFLDAGFDKSSAIKLINSVLLLRSADEVFATIDIAVVDLVKGMAEFIKIGANTTYIIRGSRVDSISSSSLPAGILGDVDIEAQTRVLRSGDVVVMLSDGVENVQDLWVEKYLQGLKTPNPQQIAEKILHEAVDRQGGASDDMSVVVGRLREAVA